MFKLAAGDTLAGVAIKYDVSVEDLKRANGLSSDWDLWKKSGESLLSPYKWIINRPRGRVSVTSWLQVTLAGLFHKTLRIHKFQIYSYCFNFDCIFAHNFKNSVIYSHFAVDYIEKSFMEQAQDGQIIC